MDFILASDKNKHSFKSVLANGNDIQFDLDASSFRSWLSISLTNPSHNNYFCQQFWFNQENPLRVKCVEVQGEISMEVYQDPCCSYGSIFNINGLNRGTVSQLIEMQKHSTDLKIETRLSFQVFSNR